MIYFRTEASQTHGHGHLNRCLIIAKTLEDFKIKTCFLCPEDQKNTANLITKSGHNIYTIPTKKFYEEEINYYPKDCHFLIIDIYHQKNIKSPSSLYNYLKKAKEKNIKIIFFDGLFEEAFRPPQSVPSLHTLIQPYLGAENDIKPNARYWLKGGQYAIMSKKYEEQTQKKIKDVAKNILITFGGADPQELTLLVMNAVKKITSGIKIRVIVGPYFSQKHKDQILSLGKKFPRLFDIKNPQTDMIPHYQWADIALSGSGLSRYEFAAIGLPAIFTAIYPNHIQSSKEFAQAGIARYIGLYTNVTDTIWLDSVTDLIKNKQLRQEMSYAGQTNIDGKGASRLAKELIRIFNE